MKQTTIVVEAQKKTDLLNLNNSERRITLQRLIVRPTEKFVIRPQNQIGAHHASHHCHDQPRSSQPRSRQSAERRYLTDGDAGGWPGEVGWSGRSENKIHSDELARIAEWQQLFQQEDE